MSETLNALLAESVDKVGVDEDQLAQLAVLAAEQTAQERLVTSLEEQLKEAKAALKTTRTERIPEFMDEVGIQEFTTSDGVKVQVKPFYQASIPRERKDEAFRWLTEHGYEDLIKVSVNFQFGKAQYEEAVNLCKQLDELGYAATPVLNVHPMTLKGWVRSMAEDGEEFPLDLFGAFIGRKAEIK